MIPSIGGLDMIRSSVSSLLSSGQVKTFQELEVPLVTLVRYSLQKFVLGNVE